MSEKYDVIDLWAKALDDNAEQQVHAMAMLDQSIRDDATKLPMVLRRMQQVTPMQRSKRRTIMRYLAIFACLIGVTSCFLFYHQWREIEKIPLAWEQLIDSDPEPPEKLKINNLTKEEELLLYGDPKRTGKAEQMKALWESDPTNPAFFADYALYYLREHRKLPADFLKIAHDIDPENAWFTCLAASVKERRTTEKGGVHPQSPVTLAEIEKMPYGMKRTIQEGRVIYEYNIMDQPNAERAMELWRKSLHQEKYDSYQSEMHRLRYPILQRRTCYQDHLKSASYMAHSAELGYGHSPNFLLIAELRKQDMLASDRRQLWLELEGYLNKILNQEPTSTSDAIVKKYFVEEIARSAQVTELDILEPTQRLLWKKRSTAILSYAESLERIRYKENEKDSRVIRARGPLMHKNCLLSYRIGRAKNLPPFDKEELKPMRLAESALFMRAACLVGIVFFTLLIPFFLLINRQKPQIRLGEEAWMATPLRAHGMIACISVIPLLYFCLIYCFTPFGCSEYGLIFFDCPLALVPFLGAILLMLALPRLMIHLLTTPFESLTHPGSRWFWKCGWLCVVYTLLPMHLMPWLLEEAIVKYDIGAYHAVIIIGYAPMILWLVASCVIGLCRRNVYQQVMHYMRRKVLMASTLTSIAALALLWCGLHPWERHWIERDELMKLSPDAKTICTYDAKLIKKMNQELREIMTLQAE